MARSQKDNDDDDDDGTPPTKTIKQSTTDPDIGFLNRDGKPKGFFYLDHRTVDSKANIITDVFVTPYLNIIGFLRTNDLCGKYLNLNLFGQPVSLIITALIAIFVVILLLLVAVLSSFFRRQACSGSGIRKYLLRNPPLCVF